MLHVEVPAISRHALGAANGGSPLDGHPPVITLVRWDALQRLVQRHRGCCCRRTATGSPAQQRQHSGITSPLCPGVMTGWALFLAVAAWVMPALDAADVNSGTRVIGVGVGTFVVLFFAVLAVLACIAACGPTSLR